jgi:phosphinothricin acetyltransferase
MRKANKTNAANMEKDAVDLRCSMHIVKMTAPREEVTIRNIIEADAKAVAEIYNHYITQTIITFEEEAISFSEIHQRIQEVQSSSLPWLVAEHAGEIVGYAYASKWRGRYAYRFSTEVTVYVASDRIGHGIGSKLYNQLLPELRYNDIHAVLAGIALPNEASVLFHEKFGFTEVAHFREVGFKFNRWIDVGYWQRIL